MKTIPELLTEAEKAIKGLSARQARRAGWHTEDYGPLRYATVWAVVRSDGTGTVFLQSESEGSDLSLSHQYDTDLVVDICQKLIAHPERGKWADHG